MSYTPESIGLLAYNQWCRWA